MTGSAKTLTSVWDSYFSLIVEPEITVFVGSFADTMPVNSIVVLFATPPNWPLSTLLTYNLPPERSESPSGGFSNLASKSKFLTNLPLQTISKLSVSTSRQNSNRTLDANKQSRVTIDLRNDCDQHIWHRSEWTFGDARDCGIALPVVAMGELASWQRRCFGVWCDAR